LYFLFLDIFCIYSYTSFIITFSVVWGKPYLYLSEGVGFDVPTAFFHNSFFFFFLLNSYFEYSSHLLLGFCIVLAHLNNSPRVDMSLHVDTLFWFRANQSLLFLLNAGWIGFKQQSLTCYNLLHVLYTLYSPVTTYYMYFTHCTRQLQLITCTFM
jgi:hypothetical protein